MLSSCWCPSWRSPTSRGDLSPPSSKPADVTSALHRTPWHSGELTHLWNFFFFLKWAASALPLSSFRLLRKSISHLGGEVCFCQTVLTSSGYASLIVKPSRWTHRSTVLSGFGSTRCEGNRCICVKHGATCCSFFYSITYLFADSSTCVSNPNILNSASKNTDRNTSKMVHQW